MHRQMSHLSSVTLGWVLEGEWWGQILTEQKGTRPNREQGEGNSGRNYSGSSTTENAGPAREMDFCREGREARLKDALPVLRNVFCRPNRELLEAPMLFPALEGTALTEVQRTAHRASAVQGTWGVSEKA